MKLDKVETVAAHAIDEIDGLLRSGALPATALTYADVCGHLREPVVSVASLDPADQPHLIAFVDEVLRVRAGGVY